MDTMFEGNLLDPGEIKNIEHINEKIRELLKESRYRHTVSVAHTAACLAMVYEESIYDALIAGLLHDCAKHFQGEDLLRKCEEKGIPVNDAERKNPSLLHAAYGAYMAEHKFDIKDENILSAIRYHTTGRPGMSMLEKIIFVADYIEPFRNQARNLEEIRREAFKDIDKALLMILEGTLDYLKLNEFVIDEMTRKTYDHYREAKLG